MGVEFRDYEIKENTLILQSMRVFDYLVVLGRGGKDNAAGVEWKHWTSAGNERKVEATIEASMEVSMFKNKPMNKKHSVHKLKKSSAYSYSITIPKEILEKYGWREKQKFIIKDKGRGKLEISDWRKR